MVPEIRAVRSDEPALCGLASYNHNGADTPLHISFLAKIA
jgi:hypothetical protein